MLFFLLKPDQILFAEYGIVFGCNCAFPEQAELVCEVFLERDRNQCKAVFTCLVRHNISLVYILNLIGNMFPKLGFGSILRAGRAAFADCLEGEISSIGYQHPGLIGFGVFVGWYFGRQRKQCVFFITAVVPKS